MRGVDAPLGAPTPWATGRSSLLGKRTRVKEREGRVRPEERGPCPSGDGFLPPQERRRKQEGEGMEGPGRLREKASTPVLMSVVRTSGCFTSATTLRQPRTSERMWRRREEVSLWGSLDHQKCSTSPRDGSGDPRPAFVDRRSPMVTTVESVKGALVLSRRSSDCSDWPARARPGESEQGAMAQGSTMTPCSGASPEEAKRMRRVSGARTWQWPLERGCRDLSGDLPCRGRDG